ncbi:MAG: RtcB family protein [Candidatus Poseidoniaceae archaeon]|nr:RtcB family protein [Candidatus Poseidoniaceae archaeon]
MAAEWTKHVDLSSPGVVRIKAHNRMKVDAAIVSTMDEIENYQDGRGPIQLMNATELPGIVGTAWGMADWHYGYGLPIGGVVATDIEHGDQGGAISPGAVGFDINCGVRAVALNIEARDIPNLEKLARRLNGRIPAGGSGKGGIEMPESKLNTILRGGLNELESIDVEQHHVTGTIESEGCFEVDELTISQRAKQRGMRALGTLGSGNHFLELQRVSEIVDAETAKKWKLSENQVVAMIHSGSRGLGHQVCSDHIHQLELRLKQRGNFWVDDEWGYELPDRQLASAPIHSKQGQAYLNDMKTAANYAFTNRAVLTDRLFKGLKAELGEEVELSTLYDVSHNIAKIEEHVIHGKNCTCAVHRKGATRAFSGTQPELHRTFAQTGQPVVVPGDMGRGSWLMAGPQTEQNQAFGSACHGAGRALSRSAARRKINPEAKEKELREKGIIVQAATKNILSEEAPEAYKNVDRVIQNTAIANLARPVLRLEPMTGIKG